MARVESSFPDSQTDLMLATSSNVRNVVMVGPPGLPKYDYLPDTPSASDVPHLGLGSIVANVPKQWIRLY